MGRRGDLARLIVAALTTAALLALRADAPGKGPPAKGGPSFFECVQVVHLPAGCPPRFPRRWAVPA